MRRGFEIALRKRWKTKELIAGPVSGLSARSSTSIATEGKTVRRMNNQQEDLRQTQHRMFGRKKEEKKESATDDYLRKAKTMPKPAHSERNNTLKITVPGVDLQPKLTPAPPPPPSNAPPTLNYEYSPGLYDTPIGSPPMRFHPPAPPPYPPPTLVPPTIWPQVSKNSLLLKEEQFDEVSFTPPHAAKLTSAEKSSSKDVTSSSQLQTPSVFEVSEFLQQLDPLARREAVNGTSDKPIPEAYIYCSKSDIPRDHV
ncbi:hypothetical protein OSTOST_07161 [Ostertagia ostertagi]